MSEPLLDVGNLMGGYGDMRVLWDVSLRVEAGQVVVVLGRNGAGKTTLLSTIAGLLPASGGTISMNGEPVDGLSAHVRHRRGVALVQEGKRIFRSLTVEQNLLLGGTELSRAALKEAVYAAYERFPLLSTRRRVPAGALSGGQQQILAIAQALVPDPALVMLDEPSAGLAPVVLDTVLRTVTELRSESKGVLMVEQLVDRAMGVADTVVRLDNGRVRTAVPR